MYLLTEWEGRTGKYLARGQEGFPRKLLAGPYGSYDNMYLLTEWKGRKGKYLARGKDVRTEGSKVRVI